MKKIKLCNGITLFFISIILVSKIVPVSADNSVSNPYYTSLDVKEKTYETGGCYLEGWPLRVSSLQTEVNPDGTISVLNWTIVNGRATIYEYDQKAKYIRTLKLEAELSKVGGFTKDTEGNYYVAFGKNVPEGAFNDISVAIVKYDKDGKKLNKYLMQAQTFDEKWSKSYTGVMQPFDEACRLEISGDMIAVYFGKSGFVAPDGYHHQSSYGFILNKETFARQSGRDTGVTIPNSVVKIGKNLFDHADEAVTIYGKTGSYAQIYAKKYGITFVDPAIAPTVKGVSNNKYYSSEVEILFNYGTATLNGKAISNGRYIFNNGSYKLVVDNGFKVVTIVSFVIDTTPPVIELRDSSNNVLKSGAITNKSFKLTYKEDNFKSIIVTKNKKNMTYPKGGLFTAKGTYVVTITDKAGNKTKVTFTIKNY
ncbi:MAG: hypothetical protein K0R00_1524 [Herbinix sp.]|jgi:hypothetical protein|nr:hypothetical protein [Herbinix sp.]